MKYGKLIIIVFIFCVTSTTLLYSENPSLAILPFSTDESLQKDANTVYELFTTKVSRTNTFNVLERSRVNQLLDEQKFAVSDLVENNKVIKIGRLLSTRGVVLGSLTMLGPQYYVVIRLVDINTGLIEFAGSVSAKNLEKLNKEMDKLAIELTSISELGGKLIKDWGIEISGNITIANNSYYAAGMSLGILKQENRLGSGIWGGILFKKNGDVFGQGGIKAIYRINDNLNLSLNLGFFPSVGIYYDSLYLDYSPLWVFPDIESHNVTAGYLFRF